MGELTEDEAAFFRSEAVIAPDAPEAPTWWRRLFRPELRGWYELHADAGPVETDDYESYEVIVEPVEPN
jgi:hypothetical protein